MNELHDDYYCLFINTRYSKITNPMRSSSHSTLMPSNGNASIKMEIVPPGKSKGEIIKRYFSDVSFAVCCDDIVCTLYTVRRTVYDVHYIYIHIMYVVQFM